MPIIAFAPFRNPLLNLNLTELFFCFAGAILIVEIPRTIHSMRRKRAAAAGVLLPIAALIAAGYFSYRHAAGARDVVLFCTVVTAFYVLIYTLAHILSRFTHTDQPKPRLLQLVLELTALFVLSAVSSTIGYALAGGPVSVWTVIGITTAGLILWLGIGWLLYRASMTPEQRIKERLDQRMRELNAMDWPEEE